LDALPDTQVVGSKGISKGDRTNSKQIGKVVGTAFDFFSQLAST